MASQVGRMIGWSGFAQRREDKDVLGVFSKLKVLGVKVKDATGKVIIVPQGSADALPW